MDSLTPQMIGSLLLADGESASRAGLQAYLSRAGWEVVLAETGRQVVEIVGGRSVDVAVVDLRLEDLHGVSLIEEVRALRPGLAVIGMASEATVELAVEAMRAGAVDVLSKPVTGRTVLAKVGPWAALREGSGTQVVRLGGCVSREPAVAAVLKEAAGLAESDLAVAISGAMGTGRKYLAGAMHGASGRSVGLQIVDTAVLSAEQVRVRLGQAVEAAGPKGAVLVADVQHLKPAEQEPLARLLKAGGVARIFVTLSDTPGRLLAANRLCKGLADRLGAGVLSLPPLAARRGDIRLLAGQIIEQVVASNPPALSPAAVQALYQYDWPGNVRQLRLVLERAARLAGASAIEPRHLPILQAVHRAPVPVGWVAATPVNLQEIVDNIERELIESALCRTQQNQAKAAELLGIPRTTLRDKLEKYGFTPKARAEGVK